MPDIACTRVHIRDHVCIDIPIHANVCSRSVSCSPSYGVPTRGSRLQQRLSSLAPGELLRKGGGAPTASASLEKRSSRDSALL